MNGKKARAIRRQVFDAMVAVYKQVGTQLPASQYEISPNGRYILCTGYRKLYKQAKRQWKEARNG